jgi:hypothetical protein
MVGLSLKIGMETKQIIFSVQPSPKQRRKRIDYEIHNYCATCRITYPKNILRCSDCKHRIRTTGWHRSKVVDKKRI